MNNFKLTEQLPELTGELVDELLTPTKIYVKSLLPLIKKELINGVAHITGGGFVENIPRMLPENTAAFVELGSWPVLPIFLAMEKYGEIPAMEMYEIFNMGIGMVLAISPDKLAQAQAVLSDLGEESYVIGKVINRNDEESQLAFSEVSR